MKKFIFFLFFCCMCIFTVNAQCDEFTVYNTKGNVTIENGTSRVPAKKNMKILKGSVLQVAPESSVILLSGSDQALRIATSGSYNYQGIYSLCKKNQTSLTKEYVKYVAQSVIEKEEPITAMVVKGAVYRTRTVFEKTDMILPADSSVISSDPVVFVWHPTLGAPLYLNIYENGVNEIYSKQLSDTTVMVGSSIFKPQTLYFWLVSPNRKPTDKEVRFTFVYGKKEWKTDFLDNGGQWAKELESEINATEQKLRKKKQQ